MAEEAGCASRCHGDLQETVIAERAHRRSEDWSVAREPRVASWGRSVLRPRVEVTGELIIALGGFRHRQPDVS